MAPKKKKEAEDEKDGAAGALPRILPDLPDQVDGTKLRSLSKTKARSANLVDDVDFDDQELCHKVPNHILTLAYNTTSDPVIKSDMVKQNFRPLGARFMTLRHSSCHINFPGSLGRSFGSFFSLHGGREIMACTS